MARSRILLVDDESALLLTYRMILEQSGYQVATASSLAEAQSQLRTQNFDLLICDLTLGKQDSGFQVIEFARNLSPSLPAVLLTGLPSSEVVNKAEAKDVTVVFKPVEIRALLDLLVSKIQAK